MPFGEVSWHDSPTSDRVHQLLEYPVRLIIGRSVMRVLLGEERVEITDSCMELVWVVFDLNSFDHEQPYTRTVLCRSAAIWRKDT